MLNFRINNPSEPEPQPEAKHYEYEIGTQFTFKGMFTFITSPVQMLNVSFA